MAKPTLTIHRIMDSVAQNGKVASNSYILATRCANEHSNCWAIDPGISREIEKLLSEHSLKLNCIILTHCHEDHIAAVNVLREKHDLELMYDKKEFDQRFYRLECFEDDSELPPADKWLTDNEEIRLGDLEFRVWEVGGHSPGSICLYHDSPVQYKNRDFDALLITGDLMYKGVLGKSNIIGADEIRFYDTMAERIWQNKTLPPNTLILGGHFGWTTVKKERAFWERWVRKQFNAYLEKLENHPKPEIALKYKKKLMDLLGAAKRMGIKDVEEKIHEILKSKKQKKTEKNRKKGKKR